LLHEEYIQHYYNILENILHNEFRFLFVPVICENFGILSSPILVQICLKSLFVSYNLFINLSVLNIQLDIIFCNICRSSLWINLCSGYCLECIFIFMILSQCKLFVTDSSTRSYFRNIQVWKFEKISLTYSVLCKRMKW